MLFAVSEIFLSKPVLSFCAAAAALPIAPPPLTTSSSGTVNSRVSLVVLEMRDLPFVVVRTTIAGHLAGPCDGHHIRSVSLSTRSHPCRLEQRPDIGAATAAVLADEQGFKIRESDVIWPALRVDLDMVRAAVVGTANQEAAKAAGGPHFPKRNFLLAPGHRRGLL
jgi:hypothetical protein